jgi:hypothetical protein
MTTRLILTLAIAALLAGSFVRPASPASDRGDPARVAIVVPADRPDLRARAQAAVASASGRPEVSAELRVARTPTEQLAVTHALAVRRFATVVGVGLDRRISVDPVAARFPEVRFLDASTRRGGLERTFARAVSR